MMTSTVRLADRVQRRVRVASLVGVTLGVAGAFGMVSASRDARDDLVTLNRVTRHRLYAWAVSAHGLSVARAPTAAERERWTDSLGLAFDRLARERDALLAAPGRAAASLRAGGSLAPLWDSLSALERELGAHARRVTPQPADEDALRLARWAVVAMTERVAASVESDAAARTRTAEWLGVLLALGLGLQALAAGWLVAPALRALRVRADEAEQTTESLVVERTQLAGELVGSVSAQTALTHLVNATDVGLVTVDAALRIGSWNPAMQRLTGCMETDAIGTSLADIWPDMSGGVHEAALRDALGGSPRTLGTVRTPSGRAVRVAASPIRDNTSRVTSIALSVVQLPS